MTIDYARIYRHHAGEYDRLVSAEDKGDNALSALQSICDLGGATVLEVGAGTGRISRLLGRFAARVFGFDVSLAMLKVAAERLAAPGRERVGLSVADARALPVRAGWADLAIAGWVYGHFTEWFSRTWPAETARALGELERALRPDGTVVILETLGTGRSTPAAPTRSLAEYYAWLEHERGFSRIVVRTDYEFPSIGEAVALTRLFFGDALAAEIERLGTTCVPECTGIWWRRVAE